MPSNRPAKLPERLFCDKSVTTHLSLGSITLTALTLGSQAVNAILPRDGRVVTSTYVHTCPVHSKNNAEG